MKNKSGFTLIEIIFSVAFLCIVSVVMLQLLFASYNKELETDTLDIATIHTMNGIELIKSQGPEIGLTENLYDDMWQKTSDVNDVKYKHSVRVTETSDPGLFSIQSEVFDMQENEIVISMTTKHYFGGEK